MRYAAFLDCLQIFKQFGIDPSRGKGIDIGRTEIVYLDGIPSPNPLLQLNNGLVLLDKGFTVEHLRGRRWRFGSGARSNGRSFHPCFLPRPGPGGPGLMIAGSSTGSYRC